MTYEEMKKKAKLYNEMNNIHSNKSKKIAESEQRIQQLKQEIKGLEENTNQQLMNELGSKKFFFKKPEPVNIDELILEKELEIRREEKNIDVLKKTATKELVDMDAILNECKSILDKQRELFEGRIGEVVAAREKYHGLIDRYNTELHQHNKFAHEVQNRMNIIYKEGFFPQYMGDSPETVGSFVSATIMSEELIQGHRKHIHELYTQPNSIQF